MADDHTQRPFRSNPAPSHDAPGGARGASAVNDPLAELARLIGQNDPFADYGSRQNTQRAAPPPPRRQPSPEWAAHVAADAGYIPPPAAPPPQAGSYPPPPELHPAEYAPSAAEYVPAAHEHGIPGYGGGEGGYEPEAYYPNIPQAEDGHHDFYDDVPPRRRMGILAIAAVFALAVVGTAGAFGYRALFGSSGSSGPPPVIKADTSPVKVVPPKKDAKNGKLIYDRVANHEQGEKLVSREEQPVDIDRKTAGVLPPQSQNGMPSGSVQPELGSGVVGGTPRKIHTIAIRPDGTAMADATPGASPPLVAPVARPAPAPAKPMAPPPRAAAAKPEPAPAPHHAVARAEPPIHHRAAPPRNAPLSLHPNAPAPALARRAERPLQTANAAPTQTMPAHTAQSASGSGYAVQIAARHSEADAQASLHSLQARYPQQLSGQHTMVRRVDLGAKGIYYRAMIGPFANSEAASHMCSKLKAAGATCFVQRI